MSPISASDGGDSARLGDELVPGIAAVVDDFIVGLEDAI